MLCIVLPICITRDSCEMLARLVLKTFANQKSHILKFPLPIHNRWGRYLLYIWITQKLCCILYPVICRSRRCLSSMNNASSVWESWSWDRVVPGNHVSGRYWKKLSPKQGRLSRSTPWDLKQCRDNRSVDSGKVLICCVTRVKKKTERKQVFKSVSQVRSGPGPGPGPGLGPVRSVKWGLVQTNVFAQQDWMN